MTTFPRNQVVRAPAAIAKSTREVTRAHSRLDQDESTLSQHTAQIATNAANITTAQTDTNANTTAIAAVNTGSGGTAQENFLGSLGQMSHITDGSPTATGPWSDSGVLQGGPTTYWTATAADALIGWMNNVDNDISTLFSLFGDLLTELQNSKFMNT